MNESTMKACPSSGPTLPICESAQPPSPAIPAPSENASRSIQGVATPRPEAIPRFCITARTRSARPGGIPRVLHHGAPEEPGACATEKEPAEAQHREREGDDRHPVVGQYQA